MATYGTINIFGTNYTLYGFPGSTERDELNRLANGGASYPKIDNYIDEQAAANKWAGINVDTSYLATSYALNLKYNNTRKHTDFKDYNGICNELAGLGADPSKWVDGLTALRLIPS